MNSNQQTHLTYDEQLRAMVDTADLSDSRRRHLEACETCRREVNGLEQRFVQLGKTAEALAPAPKRPFRLPAQRTGAAGRRFNPMWATGALAVLLFMTVIWWPENFSTDHPPGPSVSMTAQQLIDDRQFMKEVDALIENALPEPYRQLAASATPPTDLDEDLINWIVPSIEEEDGLT